MCRPVTAELLTLPCTCCGAALRRSVIVLCMLRIVTPRRGEQGEQIPGIRTDIIDLPPQPAIAPTPPTAAPRRKPWQSGAGTQAGNLQSALQHAAERNVAQPSSAAAFGGLQATLGHVPEAPEAWMESPLQAPVTSGGAPDSMYEVRTLLKSAAQSGAWSGPAEVQARPADLPRGVQRSHAV